MIMVANAFLKSGGYKGFSQDPIGYVDCNYFHVVQGQEESMNFHIA